MGRFDEAPKIRHHAQFIEITAKVKKEFREGDQRDSSFRVASAESKDQAA
jgi:hypothetical protein